MRKLVLVGVALILSVMLVPASMISAADQDTGIGDHSVRANQEQLKLIQDLYGKPITVGEYLEKVFPDELEKMRLELPQDAIKHLYEVEMQWEPLPERPLTSSLVGAEQAPLTQTQGGRAPTVYTDLWAPSAVPGSGEVDHKAKISSTAYMIWIWCQSNLWYYEVPGGWNIVDSVSNWRSMFFKSVSANGEHEISDDGYYWTTGSYSWTHYPPYGSGAYALSWPVPVYLSP